MRSLTALLVAAAVLSGCNLSPKTDSEVLATQQEIRDTSRETLARLETIQPGARKAAESAYAHAVFSNFGMKIFVAGGGTGRGVAVEHATSKETFMRMAELQAGLGMGVKKFRLVWVFTTEQAYRDFVDKGWTFGGQATASAQKGSEGGGMAGALAVAPGVYLYQITDTGLALELTVKGTKYYKDDELN